jgi:hypothetical protein
MKLLGKVIYYIISVGILVLGGGLQQLGPPVK